MAVPNQFKVDVEIFKYFDCSLTFCITVMAIMLKDVHLYSVQHLL